MCLWVGGQTGTGVCVCVCVCPALLSVPGALGCCCRSYRSIALQQVSVSRPRGVLWFCLQAAHGSCCWPPLQPLLFPHPHTKRPLNQIAGCFAFIYLFVRQNLLSILEGKKSCSWIFKSETETKNAQPTSKEGFISNMRDFLPRISMF